MANEKIFSIGKMVDGRHAISKDTSFPEKSNMAFATEKHTVKRRKRLRNIKPHW